MENSGVPVDKAALIRASSEDKYSALSVNEGPGKVEKQDGCCESHVFAKFPCEQVGCAGLGFFGSSKPSIVDCRDLYKKVGKHVKDTFHDSS